MRCPPQSTVWISMTFVFTVQPVYQTYGEADAPFQNGVTTEFDRVYCIVMSGTSLTKSYEACACFELH